MWQHLRIATASICLTLCFGSVALWVQSYYFYWTLQVSLSNSLGFCLSSDTGSVGCEIFDARDLSFWRGFNVQENSDEGTLSTLLESLWGFDFYQQGYDVYFSVPYLLLALITSGLAMLLKPKPRLKFSIRELLMFSTIAAIMFGGVGAVSRLPFQP